MKNLFLVRVCIILILLVTPFCVSGQEQTISVPRKPWQKLNLGLSWIPGDGSDGLGMTRFNIDATFPFAAPQTHSYLRSSYFMLTPKFEFTSVDWKRDTTFPDSLYDVGLGFSWFKPINDRWSFMAGATPRWSSDGKESSGSVRCSAMFGLNWTPNDRWKVLLGIAYLDRDDDLDFIPYAGFVWTPNDDWRIEMTLPQARVAKRLRTASCHEMSEKWAYLGFRFGGGNWAIRSRDHRADMATYREYSFLLGYESVKRHRCTLNLEVAYTFGREMEFDKRTQPDFEPDDSVSLRARLTF